MLKAIDYIKGISIYDTEDGVTEIVDGHRLHEAILNGVEILGYQYDTKYCSRYNTLSGAINTLNSHCNFLEFVITDISNLIKIPKGVTFIRSMCTGSGSPSGTLVIPDTVTCIYDSCFALSRYSEVVLSKNLHILDNGVFSGCIGLKSINLPSSLREIGWECFCSCKELRYISIPSNCRVKEFAFCESGLEIIEVGSNTIFEGNVLEDCESLMTVKVRTNSSTHNLSLFSRPTELDMVLIGDNCNVASSFFSRIDCVNNLEIGNGCEVNISSLVVASTIKVGSNTKLYMNRFNFYSSSIEFKDNCKINGTQVPNGAYTRKDLILMLGEGAS